MAAIDPGASSITVAGRSSQLLPFALPAAVVLTVSYLQSECDLLLSEKPPNCMLLVAPSSTLYYLPLATCRPSPPSESGSTPPPLSHGMLTPQQSKER